MAKDPAKQGATQHPVAIASMIAVSLCLTGFVVAWSTASPLSDPVGGWLADRSAQWSRLMSWRDAGPVDAQPEWQRMQLQVLNGDADHGQELMTHYGCGACHIIPGVSGARGTVGPSLTGFSQRAYVAGVLSNTPGDLTRWLINPPLFAPDTAMPDLDVTEADARDMAAYLYTLDRVQ